MALTQWFVKGEKPHHKGVYQRIIGWDICYSYWDGKYWYVAGSLPKIAIKNYQGKICSVHQDNQWRGIAK